MAVLLPVGAGARTGSGLADFAAAVHAAARRGRGEALAAEPFDRARVLAFCLRVGVGVRAAHAVFFITLGIVFFSSSDVCRGAWTAYESDAYESDDFVWPLQSVFVATVCCASPVYEAKNWRWVRRCKPEVDTNDW